MKARCPHGSPWHVECWPCADEVLAEHRRKVIPLRRPDDFSIYLDEYQYPMFGVRGCGYTGFDRAFDGVPFFSSNHPEKADASFYGDFDPSSDFESLALTPQNFLRWITEAKRRLFGRHLRVVESPPEKEKDDERR